MRSMQGTAFLVAALLAFPGVPLGAASTGEIVEETARTFRGDNHLITFWWLPSEYWIAAAREAGKTESEVQAVAALYDNYTLVAVMDIQFKPGGEIDALSTVEIVRSSLPAARIAPTIVIPEIAFDPDISGVCSSGGTFAITSKPTKIDSVKIVSATAGSSSIRLRRLRPANELLRW